MLHEMRVLDRTGHTTTTWDPDDPSEVEAARETFDAMRAKGYRMFSDGKRLDTFDPAVGKMTAVPQLKGG